MVTVSIVILNWNGWKDTIECLKSIDKLVRKEFLLQIIIVDNASTNESVEEINKYIAKRPEIIFIKNSENLGFAGGNNIGMQKAIDLGHEYVVVLNNDTIVDSLLIDQLVTFMNKTPNAGAASPKMYFAKGFEFHKKILTPHGVKNRYKKSDLGKVIWYAGGDIDWNNVYGVNRGVDEVDHGQFDVPTQTTFGSGACLFIRTSVLQKVGLFDERYFLYLEDTDLCMRIRRAGYTVYYVPSAYLWHKVSQSSSIGSQLNDYFITRNRLIFGARYATLRANVALFRESITFLFSGRPWQKKGVVDYYTHRFGKGTWNTL